MTYLIQVVLRKVSKLPGGRHAQGGVEEAALAESQEVIQSGRVRRLPCHMAKRHCRLHAHPARVTSKDMNILPKAHDHLVHFSEVSR